jgi:putative hydrolase of the HAD superfamily
MTAGVFRTLSRKKLKLYPDTLPVLKALRRAGKKIYLLSNAQTLFTVPEMEMCGVYGYFDDIFISSDYGIKKPQKEFMERLLDEYQISPKDALMIGNEIRSDCAVAAECGVPSVFLNTDRYTEKEIAKQIREYLPQGYAPLIIADGRLSHLLTDTGGHHNA